MLLGGGWPICAEPKVYMGLKSTCVESGGGATPYALSTVEMCDGSTFRVILQRKWGSVVQSNTALDVVKGFANEISTCVQFIVLHKVDGVYLIT